MENEKKNPYEIAKDILQERRNSAISEANARTEKFHQLAPESIAIDEELSNTSMKIFMITMSHDQVEEKISQLKKENEELQEKRRQLLKKHNLPSDYTSVRYSCPLCFDTGYTSVKMCSCMKSIIQMEQLKNSGLGALVDSQSFDTFSLSYYPTDSKMPLNLNKCQDYAKNFVPGKENLLFIGGTGLGKTHLSTSIAVEVVKVGYSVIYESAQNVFNAFEYDKFKNAFGQEESKSNKFRKVPLLILDDLGTEFSTQFTNACLYQIVNERMVNGLSTIISTNLSVQELIEKYDQRLISRLLGTYTLVQFEGEDIRLQKLKQR